ncbi:MAG: Nif3-like dinuclear metal center hexameric protein, partial [Bacteroidia bacterium]
MQIGDIIDHLESVAPADLQESYDNSGLIVGERSTLVNGVLISLDCTEDIVHEALAKGCNLIVAHHPIVFIGLKRFNNANYVQRTVQLAIRNDIAIYAIHTNLDNVFSRGVNGKIAERLGLTNIQILAPKSGRLLKLVTYCPLENEGDIRNALFGAGAGHISKYSECSFTSYGKGSFKGGEGANPAIGEVGERHVENEAKIEVVLDKRDKRKVFEALIANHTYEEVAYEMYEMLNSAQSIGSGMIGELPESLPATEFLQHLKSRMELSVVKYTDTQRDIKTVALCGGSGQFLLGAAMGSRADAYISADFKYHEYFDIENKIMICDIGHYESEKYTIDLLYDILSK